MTRATLFLLTGLAAGILRAAQTGVVPLPVHQELRAGAFVIKPETVIAAASEVAAEAQALTALLHPATGYVLKMQPPVVGQSGVIALSLDAALAAQGPEAYTLEVAPAGITLRGASPAGVYRGIQTLRQLLPVQIENKTRVEGVTWSVPCVAIRDYPRFAWRGLLLDVSRHFFSKADVKLLLDAMALQKMNVFHLHLTDDQGWRIEIKKHPRLTEIGAWRKGIGFGLDPQSSTTYGPDGRYGGFYTQDDIREIVAYAQARHITIVPDIEMPGHSGAVLAAYPALSCEGKERTTDFAAGVHANVYCAGREEPYAFLQEVLAEVFTLFPGSYVHIGGDEVPKGNWNKCEKCQARIKAEGLKNAHELQSYFIRRMEKFINTKGKTLIGWSEIREGGLARNAALMDWIGGAVEGASEGHDVVMSPTSHCYLDYSQGRAGEPRGIGGYIPLRTVYAFEPLPSRLKPEFHKHIIGVQGNVWTEYIAAPSHMQYMAFPRGIALAEVGWTPAAQKNYDTFLARLSENLLPRLDAMGVNYRKLTPEPVVIGRWKSGETGHEFAEKTWPLGDDIMTPGSYELTFQYTKGEHRLDIAWAALFANGQEVARDTHDGVTGASQKANVYHWKVESIPAGAHCELKARVRSDGGADSNGEIYIQRTTR